MTFLNISVVQETGISKDFACENNVVRLVL